MTGGFAPLPSTEEDASQWIGVSRILGPPWAQLPALTVGLLGVQTLWSIEMAYGSPYLLSLGLTKSYMAMVFLAGPLSGLVVQPLVGILADSSKSRFGRRRPFMLAGAAITAFGMLLLGFTKEFASIFSSGKLLTVWLAVLAIYSIDFSVNAVQAMDRALIVDTLPPAEQSAGNAWAARMLGVGAVAGFFFGNMDLPGWFPLLGNSELQVLSVLGSGLLISSQLFTAFSVKEKILVSSGRAPKGLRQEFEDIWDNILTLPRTIRQICMIQFFAWIGWFPFLFYTTAYIGDLHLRASPLPADGDEAAIAALNAEGTRLGSRAMFYHSLLALAANVFLPFFVKEKSNVAQPSSFFEVKKKSILQGFQVHLSTLWAASHLLFFVCMEGTWFTSSVGGNTFLMALLGVAWAITQWAPFALLAEAILSESPVGADEAGSIRLGDRRTNGNVLPAVRDEEREHFLVGDGEEDEDEDEDKDLPAVPVPPQIRDESPVRTSARPSLEGHRRSSSLHPLGNLDARMSSLDVSSENGLDHNPAGSGLAAKSGIILGIHNIFIVIPQFLSTGLSSIIFAFIDPDKSVLHGKHPGSIVPPVNTTVAAAEATTAAALLDADRDDGPNTYAIIFRLGGLAAAVACVLTWRLSKELRRR